MPSIFQFVAFLFLCLFAAPVQAGPETLDENAVSVRSAIVFDLDNDAILFEQNADMRIPPASLTKVLSMFLARDFMKNGHATLDSLVPVSSGAAAAGGSSMGLHAGESVPLGKLLLGMAVSSGNDASHAVAEYVGGSTDAFVRMMNAKAAEIGMRDSVFQNPHGLPARRQYTTARDMLALGRAYLNAYPDALDMHNQLTLTHSGYTSWNKNPLLGQYPGADGLKTGWIRASGYNMIFTASRGDKRLLAVILGAPTPATRAAEACRLLDAGFKVCGNDAVSIAAALDGIPYDDKRIDPLKTGRDAGLLKKRSYGKRNFAEKKDKYGRKQWASQKTRKVARSHASRSQVEKGGQKRKSSAHHASRKTGRRG